MLNIVVDQRLVGGTKAAPNLIEVGKFWATNGHWAVRVNRITNLAEVKRWATKGRTPWGADCYLGDRADREFVVRIRDGQKLGSVTVTGWTLRMARTQRFDGDWRPQPPATFVHLRGREVGNYLILARYVRAFRQKRWTVLCSAFSPWGGSYRHVLCDYQNPSLCGVFVLPVVAGQGGTSANDQRPPIASDVRPAAQPSFFGGRRSINLEGEE